MGDVVLLLVLVESDAVIYFSGNRIKSSIDRCSLIPTMVLAVMAPDAAVAGTPMEGKV